MTATSFGLQPHLDALADTRRPRFAFRARSVPEFLMWQSEFCPALAHVLGIQNRAPVPVVADKISMTENGTYVEEKYSLDVGEGVLAPMYLLVPKRKPPFKTILVFHGHDLGVQTVLGHYENQASARENIESDNNYAQRLAEAGYLVCAIEQRGMGERLTNQTRSEPYPRSCRHLSFDYLMQGRTLLGERVWDGICALNYLQTREGAYGAAVGCTGHSGGGTTALFLAALDSRIKTTVISGYLCSFRESILAMPHRECNYVPSLLELGEMGDIAALIAPRSLRIVHGAQDPIFPLNGTRAQFDTVKRAFTVSGNVKGCDLMVHPFAHRYYFSESHSWFENTL